MEHKNHNQDQNEEAQEDLVFFVRIQYRRNTSWQGTIQWMDGKQQMIFRSALELGNLINDARKKASGTTNEVASGWKDKESAS